MYKLRVESTTGVCAFYYIGYILTNQLKSRQCRHAQTAPIAWVYEDSNSHVNKLFMHIHWFVLSLNQQHFLADKKSTRNCPGRRSCSQNTGASLHILISLMDQSHRYKRMLHGGKRHHSGCCARWSTRDWVNLVNFDTSHKLLPHPILLHIWPLLPKLFRAHIGRNICLI